MAGLPLAGLRVVSLEQAVAAPLCSRHLADLGADVIKVERTGRGDFARDYDDFVSGMSSHFVWLNRGKRSIALDLKSAEGREVLLGLLATADVFLSNLGPGAVDRIVPDDLLTAANPGLVRCRISGYGPDSPYEQRKAFDLLVQGESGVTASTGEAGHLAKPGVSLADLGAGIYAATAVLAALRARDASGRGDLVEIAMFDVMVEWMSPLLLAYREAGVVIPPAGMRHATITPYGPFTTLDGAAINIAVQNDRQWLALCTVLGLGGLAAQPDLATNRGRLARRALVEGEVARAASLLRRDDLADGLEAAGVPWGALNGIAEAAHHPQLESTHRWEPVVLPSGGHASVVASPFRSPAAPRPKRIPALGEDGPAILADLDYDQERIQRLVAAGIIQIPEMQETPS